MNIVPSARLHSGWLLLAVLWVLAPCVRAANLSESVPSTQLRKPNVEREKAQNPAPASKRVEQGPIFTIERIPSWVQPVAAEAVSGLDPAPVQVLLVDRQTRVGKSSTTYFTHAVRQINDNAGVQKGAQIQIEFDPSYQRLVLHQLFIWRGAQRIDKLDRKLVKLLHRETQLERQIVDGRMTASIVLDDLRAGDRVEWAASLVGDNPVFAGRFVDIEWSRAEMGPIGQLRVRLLAPADRNIRYRIGDPAVQVDTQVRSGWRELVFRSRNMPQFRFDPLLPPSEYLKDQIEFSEFSDWGEVASWAERLFDKATNSSAAVDERVAQIHAQAVTAEAQVRVALDFVQKEVRYFGNEIGPDSHQPATADEVLRQRFGDCKDKVALLTALLKRLGVQATPVLVSIQYGAGVRQRLPSPLAFDHVIESVSLEGKVLWLDATRSQQTGAPASRQPVGLGFGLLARTGTEHLQELPSANGVLRSETVDIFSFPTLAKEGSLESVTTYYGDLAELVRDAKANVQAPDFQKLVVGDMLRAYPSLVLVGEPKLERVTGQNAIRVSLRYRVGDYWKFPEQRVLVGNFSLLSLASPLRLPDQTPRTQALRIPMPGRYLHTLKFEFGEQSFSQASSSSFDESNANFELHIRYSGQPKEQLIEGELNLVAERVEASNWIGYRDQLTKIWPRLANAIGVPVLAPDQVDSVRSDLAALEVGMRKGDIRVTTREQASARARLLVLDKQLSVGRIPDYLRAGVLVARGTQFDRLGRAGDGQSSFEEAIALDKNNAEAHAALAVNALMRGFDDVAVQEAGAALQLTPSDIQSRYTRVWAHYFAGDFAKSQSELQEILQSRNEVERSYGGIWLYLAARRLGGDGVSALRPYMPNGARSNWPHPVLQWFSGAGDFDSALAATRDGGQVNRGRECELYFYAAEKALLDSDVRLARAYLKKSLATGVVEFNEFAMAQRELDRIDKH